MSDAILVAIIVACAGPGGIASIINAFKTRAIAKSVDGLLEKRVSAAEAVGNLQGRHDQTEENKEK
jgi:hypothetical protein